MRSLNALELNKPEPIRLPASSFPQWADIYVCDNCGADVTTHLHHHAGHSYPPYGPERYVCCCGNAYLTGATEWDNLGPRERRRRIVNLFGTFFVFFAVLGLFGVPAGLVVYFVWHSVKLGFVTGLLISLVPALVLPVSEVVDILRSVTRTRLWKIDQVRIN